VRHIFWHVSARAVHPYRYARLPRSLDRNRR
jgi:hypothetical protein